MQPSISEKDITDYVLNELPPRERLYVESMMLGCEASRQEAVELIEVSRLLEEGMLNELAFGDLALDEARRRQVFESSVERGGVWHPLAQVAATAVALAACVAFSVAAPVISKYAFRPDSSKSQLARQSYMDEAFDVIDPGSFPVAMFDVDEVVQSVLPEDFPTHVLLPTGAVNIGEMPMPYLGGDSN